MEIYKNMLQFDSKDDMIFSSCLSFINQTPDIETIKQWMKKTLVYVVGGGHSYWLTKGFDKNNRLVINSIKEFEQIFKRKIRYSENGITKRGKEMKSIKDLI